MNKTRHSSLLEAMQTVDSLDLRSMFDHALGDGFRENSEAAANSRSPVLLPVAVSETGKTRVVQVTIPGLDEDDLEIRVDVDRFTISASRECRGDGPGSLVREHVEITFRNVAGDAPVPWERRPEITTSYDGTVLTIRLRKPRNTSAEFVAAG